MVQGCTKSFKEHGQLARHSERHAMVKMKMYERQNETERAVNEKELATRSEGEA